MNFCEVLELFARNESSRTLCKADNVAVEERLSCILQECKEIGEATMDRLKVVENYIVAYYICIVFRTYQDGLSEFRVSSNGPEMLPNGCLAYAVAFHTIFARARITRQSPPVCFPLFQFPKVEVAYPPRIWAVHSGTINEYVLAQCLKSPPQASKIE